MFNFRSKTIFSVALFVLSGFANATDKPKNIIIMIGDGMGPSHITAYRHFKDDPKTKEIEETVFDKLFIGKISTDSDDKVFSVTDSAASATAYSCGIKTYKGSICYDVNHKPQTPLFEKAVKAGMKTGVVVTSQVNHATPAAFASSVESRREYPEIARQYATRKVNGQLLMDVILGGGQKYFTKEKNKHLLENFKKNNYQISLDEKSFLELDHKKPILGLYGKKGMASYLDRKHSQITLPNMAKVALERLSKSDKGFVLLIEGSQIDWASHGDNVLDAMWETDEFAASVKTAVEFAKKDGETLVLITADHETGGLSLGSNNIYNWEPSILLKAKHSVSVMVKQKIKGLSWNEIFKQQSIELTKEQLEKAPEDTTKEIYFKYIVNIYSELTQTGWTTSGHSGVDVWLMAYGVGSENFRGHWANDVIGQMLIELVE